MKLLLAICLLILIGCNDKSTHEESIHKDDGVLILQEQSMESVTYYADSLIRIRMFDPENKLSLNCDSTTAIKSLMNYIIKEGRLRTVMISDIGDTTYYSNRDTIRLTTCKNKSEYGRFKSKKIYTMFGDGTPGIPFADSTLSIFQHIPSQDPGFVRDSVIATNELITPENDSSLLIIDFRTLGTPIDTLPIKFKCKNIKGVISKFKPLQ
jgi:hypothetical protein